MRLILQQRLFDFAPRARHADDLLLDQHFRSALLDVAYRHLFTTDRVKVIMIPKVCLETGQAVVSSFAEHRLDHYL